MHLVIILLLSYYITYIINICNICKYMYIIYYIIVGKIIFLILKLQLNANQLYLNIFFAEYYRVFFLFFLFFFYIFLYL